MKRPLISFALTLATAGVALSVPAPAQADTRGCVTRWEYAHIYAGQSPTRVKAVFDTGGYEYNRLVAFNYDGASDYDQDGNLVGYAPAYVDEFDNWIDEQGGYARDVDFIRSYKKCRRFDNGRGRVGVLYDNYTFGGNGAFSRERYHPSNLQWWLLLDFSRSTPKAPKTSLQQLGGR